MKTYYKVPEKWRGAISYSKKLTKDAVICLFEDSWRASATEGHTHNRPCLHFKRNCLTTEKLQQAEKYFSLLKEQAKYSPNDEKYFVIEKEIADLELS